MGEFVKGDVVVLPFPFSDLSSSKKRPALVVTPVEPYNDVILCMITSKSKQDVNSIPLTQADFIAGSLSQDSNIRPNRLFTTDTSIILRTAGKLSTEKMGDVVDEIVQIVSG